MELTEAQRWLQSEIDVANRWIMQMERQGSALTKAHWEIRKKALQDCMHAVGTLVYEFQRIIEVALNPPKPAPRIKPLTKRQYAAIDKKREQIREALRKSGFLMGRYSHECEDR